MKMQSIFLSYAGVDRDTATTLKDGLILAGLNQHLWQDIDQIRSGDNWLLKLEEALQQSSAYLLLLGPSGIHKWVKFELYLAIRRHFDSDEQFPIIPVMLPGSDLTAMPSFLSIFQAEILSHPLGKDSYIKLVESISLQLNHSSVVSSLNDTAISTQCPWPGLTSYDETWARFFFGRPTETLEAIRLLGDARDGYYRRWLQIEGPSGVGKSSLVLAGLVPAIQKGWLGEDETLKPNNWLIAKMRPGSDPIDGLAVALAIALDNWKNQSDELKLKLQNGNPETLKLIVREGSERLNPKRPLLLIVDQLEELFAAHVSTIQRDRFDQLLTNALADRGGPLHLVTTIRSDFTPKQQEFMAELSSVMNTLAERYYLGPISKAGLRDVIRSPARLAGLIWDEATLPERIIDDAAENLNPLPLVSNLLYLLWQKRQGNKLLGQTYKHLNGVGGALSTSADELWKNLTDDGRSRAKKLLLKLVSVGKDRPNTRRTISLTTALRAGGNDVLARQVVGQLSGRVCDDLNQLAGPRLIYIRPRIEGSNPSDDDKGFLVDLTHEALLTRWDLLKNWLADPIVREQLEAEEELEQDALDWESEGKPYYPDLPNPKKLERYFQANVPSSVADEYLQVLRLEQQRKEAKLLADEQAKERDVAERRALEDQITKTRKFWRVQLPIAVTALAVLSYVIYLFQISMVMHRTSLDTCVLNGEDEGLCANHALIHYSPQSPDEYRLGFVELDDQGELFDPKQLQAILDNFYQMAAQESVLIVTYVHGWHHSTLSNDSDVKEFHRLLKKLSRSENKMGQDLGIPARRVLGVYIGWRGESLPIPFMNFFEFWKQNHTASKIGSRATRIFLKLEEITHVRNSLTPPIQSGLVSIGHSMGANLLFTALQQIFEDRFLSSNISKSYTDTAKGFGNLVVLMNPTFEALRFSNLYDLSRERCAYFQEQLPKLAVLTSESDNLTNYAFPIGRFFSTMLESHTTVARRSCNTEYSYQQSDADNTAVGHFVPFITHELHALTKDQTIQNIARPWTSSRYLWIAQKSDMKKRFGNTMLTPLNKTNPLNPYLNIKVSSELMFDHNDMWSTSVTDFITYLITLSASPNISSE